MPDPVASPTFIAPPAIPDPVDPATGDTDPPDGDGPSDDGLGDKGKRALAAIKEQRDAAKRTAADLAARLKEIEDRDKTELQKAAERAETAERALEAATAERMKHTVGAAKGLTLSQSQRLRGSTQEELEADADAFLAELKTPAPAPSFQGGPRTPARPSNDPRQQFAAFMNTQTGKP